MKIGMVLSNRFPPDIRVEKEARTLLTAGHQVHLLAYLPKASHEPAEEDIHGLRVRRIPTESDELQTAQRRLNSLQFFLTFQNRYWANKMTRWVSDFDLNALHVHDLPLVKTALSVGQGFQIPVIADLHENFPAFLKLRFEVNPGSRSLLTPRPKRWVSYEGKAVQLATRVVVVVHEAKERLIDQHGVNPDKIEVLMNVEDVDHFTSLELDPEIVSRYQEFFVISYIGGGGKHRGLDTAIQAVACLGDTIPRVRLVIVGLGPLEAEQHEAMAESEGIKERVEIVGWQPFSKVPSYIQASRIGLIPHHQNPHTDATIPHKLFQYMLMGKPVVVSTCRPLKRIVEEAGSGLVFEAGDPKGLSKQILKLYENHQLQLDCGRRGHEAILSRYNWAQEGKKLCRLYDSLSQNPLWSKDFSSKKAPSMPTH
jgi:glycosyltransferase involved in cell wall biosynthesis